MVGLSSLTFFMPVKYATTHKITKLIVLRMIPSWPGKNFEYILSKKILRYLIYKWGEFIWQWNYY